MFHSALFLIIHMNAFCVHLRTASQAMDQTTHNHETRIPRTWSQESMDIKMFKCRHQYFRFKHSIL